MWLERDLRCGQESTCNAGGQDSIPGWIRKIPWRREWQPTPVFLPGEFHGQRSLAGWNLLGHKDLDTTEWLTHAYTHTHTHTHTQTHTLILVILNLSIHLEHLRWYERKRFHFFLQWYTLPRMLLPACLLLCSLAGQSHSLHKIFQMAGACKTCEINCITSHTHTHTHPSPRPHHGCVFSQGLCDGRHCHRSQR